MILKFILIVATLLAAFTSVVILTTMRSKEPMYLTSDRFSRKDTWYYKILGPRFELIKKQAKIFIISLLYIIVYSIFH